MHATWLQSYGSAGCTEYYILLGCIVKGLQHTEMLVHCSGSGSHETTVLLYLHWLHNTL